MLIIQKICLQWHKKGRGADGEKVRSQFPHAYPIAPQTVQEGVLVQNLNFYQNKSTILDAIQEEKYRAEKYRLQWVRRGHNKDYHNQDSPFYASIIHAKYLDVWRRIFF